MKRVSREHLVAIVPPVRIVERIGIEVPTVAVQVRVHEPDSVQYAINATALQILLGLYRIRELAHLAYHTKYLHFYMTAQNRGLEHISPENFNKITFKIKF